MSALLWWFMRERTEQKVASVRYKQHEIVKVCQEVNA